MWIQLAKLCIIVWGPPSLFSLQDFHYFTRWQEKSRPDNARVSQKAPVSGNWTMKTRKSSKRRRKEQFRERSLLFDLDALYNQLECQTGGNECTYKATRSNSVSRKISYFRMLNFTLTKMRSSKHCDEKLSILPVSALDFFMLHSGNFVLCVHFQRKKITRPLEKDFKSLFGKKN